MSLATDKHVLKKRLDRYIWESRSERCVTLRSLLTERFMPFGRVAIVGGMVRDFARRGRDGFSSDVDLVIEALPEHVADFASSVNAKPDRFGGYSWVVGTWKIDFWALHSTWGYRQGYTQIENLEDVINCTFFDWDAVIYELSTRSIHCHGQYLNRLKSGRLDINLMETPSVYGNLLRAVRRILLWNLELGPRLAEFIDAHLDDISFAEIAAVNQALYGDALVASVGNKIRLRFLLESKEERKSIATFYACQLALPGLDVAAGKA
jgi:hypothetical protein